MNAAGAVLFAFVHLAPALSGGRPAASKPRLSWRVHAPIAARTKVMDSGIGIIGWIIIGIVAGWIAEKVMKRNHGLLTNLIVGVIGAFLGGFIATQLGMGPNGWIMSLVVATLGAILLLWIVGMVRRRGA
jgi:uncharacterized membrane protein YeaQ/YmgE (transglycosylase-associated protein family)